jgi:hypothetical protein
MTPDIARISRDTGFTSLRCLLLIQKRPMHATRRTPRANRPATTLSSVMAWLNVTWH